MLNYLLKKLEHLSMTQGRFFSDKTYKYDTIFFVTKYLYDYISDDVLIIDATTQDKIVKKLVETFTLPAKKYESNKNYLSETLGFLVYTGVLKKESSNEYKVCDFTQLDFITVSIENAYIYQYLVAYKTFLNDNLWDLYLKYIGTKVIEEKEMLLQRIKDIMCNLSSSIGDHNSKWAFNMVKFPIMVLALANSDNVVTRTLNVKNTIIVPKDLSANIEGSRSLAAKDNFYLHDFRINYVKKFLSGINNISQVNSEVYNKFKRLIEWFVRQLNINNGLEVGIKTSGQGYKTGSAIRNQYVLWRDYESFTLDCNFVAGYQSTSSKVNYINKTGTGINIRPKFDKKTKKVLFLFIDIYGNDEEPVEEIYSILEKEYEIGDLSLFDKQGPSELLKELYDDYKKVINYYSKKQDLPVRFPRKIKLHELNTILYGAPGTGKTYLTAEYAVAIIENRDIKDEPREELMKKYRELQNNGKITFTTFHQNYGYEDFIQGLRPINNNGVVEFKTVNGVFKKIADMALNDSVNNYVIIIDEINRANVSKVLGELITLIEEDKRWGEVNELSITLPSHDVFAVPNNLYIIGTMNSSDKSISLIDAALRRRFKFIEVSPNYSIKMDAELKEVLEKLNNELSAKLKSTDLLVGHSYFLDKNINDLDNIMNNQIIPLLYEYFLDNKDKVKQVLENSIDNTKFRIVDSNISRLRISKI